MISALAALALDRVRLNEEVARRAGEMHINAIVEQTVDVILIVDEDNRIRYASPSARHVFGTSELRGVVLLDLVDPGDRRPAEYLLRHARTGDSSTGRADWTIRARDGGTALVEVSCRDLRAEDSVRGVVVTLRDVTAQRRLEHELTKHMFHDPLTGLANRRLFSDRVGQSIAANAGLAGVLLIDLDNFKAINDGLGHEVGDAVLTAVGERLSDALGHDGLAARLGADEFAALIQNLTTAGVVDELAARITQSLTAPIASGGELVRCSASVGVATTAEASSPQELLRRADMALHAAKSAGGSRWRHYEPSMTDEVVYKRELRTALSHSPYDGSLRAEYQPIVELATGRTVGLEALVRWQHPTRGRLSPCEFIEVAEESGLITPIGEWVLATALKEADRWSRAVPDHPPYVSVNVSAQQFRSANFVDTVRRLLLETPLPSDHLVLEITESLLLRDDDKVWDDLRRLRQWGVRVAIDDFGTGYSALGYLRQVPLDIVKLDRLFISTLTSSARQRELVEGIVRLTRTLNLDVVAEGIETEPQRDIAASIGCRYGQGYLLSRPMSDADAVGWLVGGRTVPAAVQDQVRPPDQA